MGYRQELYSRRGLFIPGRSETDETVPVMESTLVILKPRHFGNLEVTPHITGHNLESWNRNGKKLKEALADFDIIFPEYFPPEYAYLESDPLLVGRFVTASYKENNILFHKLADFFAQQDKQIWVVDPAHNIQFARIRMAMYALMFSPSVIPVSLLIKHLNSSREWTRREYITMCASTVLAGVSLGSERLGLSVEDDLRNVVASKLFEVVGQVVGQGLKVAVIYPEWHWKEIARYSDNPKHREEKLAWYTKLAGIPNYDSLFTARNFIQEGGNWKQINMVSLIEPKTNP